MHAHQHSCHCSTLPFLSLPTSKQSGQHITNLSDLLDSPMLPWLSKPLEGIMHRVIGMQLLCWSSENCQDESSQTSKTIEHQGQLENDVLRRLAQKPGVLNSTLARMWTVCEHDLEEVVSDSVRYLQATSHVCSLNSSVVCKRKEDSVGHLLCR